MTPLARAAALTVCAMADTPTEARTVLGRLGLIDWTEPAAGVAPCGHPWAEQRRTAGTRGAKCRACGVDRKRAYTARKRGVA